ncbi:alpha/beta fold hydrolase [Embleya sp. NPDC127516]|uniref:alpha/beta fold hydrolase n=1 Tax=Embleya sp. NPDC127516 TaxID=3363990 RepID=UPI00381B8BFA
MQSPDPRLPPARRRTTPRRGLRIAVSCAALLAGVAGTLVGTDAQAASGADANAGAVNPYGSLGAQRPHWRVCDWYTSPGPRDPDWRDHPVTSCADVRAPLDWYDRSKGTITVRVTRVASTGGSARRGVLLVNPGGPGIDGSASATRIARSQPELLRTHDIIGFAPRGVAPSTSLDCDVDWTRYDSVADARDRSPANVARQLANARLVGQACADAAFAPYVTTDQTARDLDLIRAVLGERRIDYLGFSYGTWLGVWYAAAFRDRVDRFVLDSSMNWLSTPEEVFVESWARGFRRRFDVQFLPWLARHHDRYGFGDTPEAAGAAYEELRAAVAGQGRGTALDATQATVLYNSDGWPRWAELLVTLRGDPTRAVDLLAAPRVPVGMPDSGAHWAIRCGDARWPRDPARWVAEGDRLGARYPLAGSLATEQPCAFYPFATAHPVVPNAATLPRMLMVQNQLDPATPADGALIAAAESHQPMIFVRDAGNHIAYDSGNACVDARVNAYLARGARPGTVVCEALPLPLDDVVHPVGAAGPQPPRPGRDPRPPGPG